MFESKAFMFMVTLGVSLTGCASSDHADVSVPGQGHAECTVCKHEGDLACLDVELKADTPQATYDGRAYYFCSGTCRKEFEKNPAKFAGR